MHSGCKVQSMCLIHIRAQGYWYYFQVFTSLWMLLAVNININATQAYNASDAVPGTGRPREQDVCHFYRAGRLGVNCMCQLVGSTHLTGFLRSCLSCPQPTPI